MSTPHRPPLAEELQARILGELGLLTPRTDAYRAKRREMAVSVGRTEQTVERIVRRLKARITALDHVAACEGRPDPSNEV